MAGGGRALRTSAGTLALLLVIVLLALGGALLVGQAPVLGKAIGSDVLFNLPRAVWGLLFLAPLLIGFAAYVVRWALSSPAGLVTRIGAPLAVAVVVGLTLSGIAFSVNWTGTSNITFGTTGAGPGNGTGPGNRSTLGGQATNNSSTNGTGTPTPGQNNSTSSNNTTGNSTGGGGGNPNGSGNGTGSKTGGGGGSRYGGNNTTFGSAAPTPGGGYAVSNWAFLGIAAGLSAVVAVLALPGMIGRLLDRRRPQGTGGLAVVATPAQARWAFREARLSIEAGESPREAIVRLYGRLIGRVAPEGEDLAASTAQEIQHNRLQALRVPVERSEELTRIFEEACYSSHPISRPEADRFVEAMRAFEHDLFVAGAVE